VPQDPGERDLSNFARDSWWSSCGFALAGLAIGPVVLVALGAYWRAFGPGGVMALVLVAAGVVWAVLVGVVIVALRNSRAES
jgi:hypothetical protein